MKKTTLLIKSALYLILCWLSGFVISMFFPMCYQRFGPVMCYPFGFCSLGAALCIYADFSLKAGGRMNIRSNSDMLKPSDQHFGALIGAVPAIINYIYLFVLYLSKFGVIKADLFPLYKTLTFYFMPLTYIFSPNNYYYDETGKIISSNVAAAELSVPALILLTVLPALFILTSWVSFYIGYNKIDVKEKILYGHKER